MTAESELYQVSIVKYGTRQTTKSDVYLNYHLYGEPDEPVGMDYFVWILRSAQRTVVVDTGFSVRGGEARRRTRLLDAAELFADFGVDASAGPDVVLTHAHYDHAGNLDLFDRSRVIVAERECEFWWGPHGHRALFHHSVEDDEIDHLRRIDKDGRLVRFSDRHHVSPGVEVIEVGGHTPGQSVVVVATTEGPVLLASDAIHYYEEFERDRPFTSVADVVGMYAAFDRIRAMLDAGEVDHLVSGHDPTTLGRFTPVEGKYAGLAATIGEPA